MAASHSALAAFAAGQAASAPLTGGRPIALAKTSLLNHKGKGAYDEKMRGQNPLSSPQKRSRSQTGLGTLANQWLAHRPLHITPK